MNEAPNPMSRSRNPHTARQDAETWKRLYEIQVRENAIKQVIIETMARQMAAMKEIHHGQ